jgi:AcrR family transcriptional regulator
MAGSGNSRPKRKVVRRAGVGRGASSTRERQREQTRNRLIDAAVEAFRRVGFAAATVDEIAARAGTSRPTFYAHFKSKMDVANQIGIRAAPDTEAVFQQLDALAEPSRADVREWLEKLAALWMRERVAIEAASEASMASAEMAADYLKLLSESSWRYLPNYFARLDAEQRELAHARLILLKMAQERLFFVTRIRGARFPGADELDALADIWWTVLFAPQRAGRDGS